MINSVLDEMKGMTKADIESAFPGILASLNEMDDEDDDDKDIDDEEDDDYKKSMKKEMNYKKMKKEDVDVADDTAALFEGEDLSEEFKEKATTIFHATLVSKINEKLEEVAGDTVAELAEAKENMISEMAATVDGYLEYVVEEWSKANELAIEAGVRIEVAEGFIGGLKTLFEDHNIEIPEDKIDVVEALAAHNADLEAQLDEMINSTVELRANVNSHVRDDILEEVATGLVDTDAEKLRSLAEGVDFVSEVDYSAKLSVLKENYFPGTSKVLTEDLDDESVDDGGDTVQTTGPMSHYVNAISKTTLK